MFFRDFPSTAPKYFGGMFFSFHIIIAGIIAMSHRHAAEQVHQGLVEDRRRATSGTRRRAVGVSGAQANSAFCTPAPAPGIFGSAGHPMLGSTVAFLALLMILYGYSLPWVR